MSTVTIASSPLIRRGQYLWVPCVGKWRVIYQDSAVLITGRVAHRSRALEWLHARYEDAKWALGDRLTFWAVRGSP